MSEQAVNSGGIDAAAAATAASWGAIFGGGVGAMMAASKAVSVAVETQQLSVDPQLVDAMIKKLNQMKDELAAVLERSAELSLDTKLGGGYAAQVAKANTEFGSQAAKQIAEVGKAIDSLKTQIEKSRASYKNADQSGHDSFTKINGNS